MHILQSRYYVLTTVAQTYFLMGALLEHSALKKSFKKLSRLSVFGITLALTKEPSVAISVLALTNDTWRLKC
jgi:hypothetical protein